MKGLSGFLGMCGGVMNVFEHERGCKVKYW